MEESPSTIDEDRSEVKFNDHIYSFENLNNSIPLPPPPLVFNNRQNSIQSNNSKDNENHSIFSHSNTSFNSINESLDSFDNFYDLTDVADNDNFTLGTLPMVGPAEYEYDLNPSLDSIPDSLTDTSTTYLDDTQSFNHLTSYTNSPRHHSHPHLPSQLLRHSSQIRPTGAYSNQLSANRSFNLVQNSNQFATYLGNHNHQHVNMHPVPIQHQPATVYPQTFRPRLNHHQSQPNLQIQTHNVPNGIQHQPQPQSSLAFNSYDSFYDSGDNSFTPQSIDTTGSCTPNLTPVNDKNAGNGRSRNIIYGKSNEGFSPLQKMGPESIGSAASNPNTTNNSLTSTPIKLESPLPQLTTFRHNQNPHPQPIPSQFPADGARTKINDTGKEILFSPQQAKVMGPYGTNRFAKTESTLTSPSSKNKKHTRKRLLPRSKNGCWICRIKHLKCDEIKPQCNTCLRFGVTCDYSPHKPKYVTDKILRGQKLEEISQLRKSNQKLKPKKSKKSLS